MAKGHPSRVKPQGHAGIAAFVVASPMIAWAAVIAAPCFPKGRGLLDAFLALGEAIGHPFQLSWVSATPLWIGAFLGIYALVAAFYLMSRKNFRLKEEYGSARWDTPSEVNEVFEDVTNLENNIPLTHSIRMGMDVFRHGHNLNTLVIGGSGSGKTRYFVLPGLIGLGRTPDSKGTNCSYLVTDPKGELLDGTGRMFKERGYKIRVLNLVNMAASDGYNPFDYIRSDNDVQLIVENLFANTTPPESRSNDPYWDNMAKNLLMALMLYLWHYAPREEQNFEMVMHMVTYISKSDDDEDAKSPMDILFERKKREDPTSLAVRYYELATKAPGRTMMSIVSSLVAHMDKFNLPAVARLTSRDDMEIGTLGQTPSITYVITPDDDTSFNFLAGMFYTQAIQTLERTADASHKPLPIHVRFMLDEFANIALPRSFQNSLSVFRSRNISAVIVLQALSQLKAKYEKDWESIVANCDTVLYLGGNESGTHEWLSKMLGKETIDTRSYNRSRGRNGSFSANEQQTGRELLTADEIRRLNRDEAIAIIGGYTAIDKKFPLMQHPLVGLTAAGGAEPYKHWELSGEIADPEKVELQEDGIYEMLTSDELEKLYNV